jgi:hypothetical protein
MSVSTTASQVTYAGNASTSAAYPVSFPFFDATDLSVVVNTGGVPTTLVNGTGYSVTGGNGTTGSITTTSAIPATSSVIITRSTAKTQLTSYTTGDRFPATTHERALDKLTMLVQEATTIPDTATASGAAPYVLQASSAGATPSWVPQSSGGIAAGAITNTMLAGGITPEKLSTGGPVWDASGNLTAASFVGPVTGNVTGNLTGNVTGNLTGTASAIPDLIVSTAKLANNSVTAAKLGANEQKQISKCWVNFNGTGTPVIRSSYNVSSITKNGTGDYAVNFATPMADANYSVVAQKGAPLSADFAVANVNTAGQTSSAVRVSTGYTAGSNILQDSSQVTVQIFGN